MPYINSYNKYYTWRNNDVLKRNVFYYLQIICVIKLL